MAAPLRTAGTQFEISYLLGMEGGPHPVVILALAEQMPDDHRQLARDGNGGDVIAAPGPDPFVKGTQRSWAADSLPGRFDQQVTGIRPPPLGDPAVVSGTVARLVDARIPPVSG